MIDTPTTFILGAGASKPYGYPTGFGLRWDIILHFERQLKQILLESRTSSTISQPDLFQAKEFVEEFHHSNIFSIDKYLSLNPRYSHIGKIAIAISILEAEKKSFYSKHLNKEFNSNDWYSLLFNRMIDSLTKPEDYTKFAENKVSFITFNYDRSLDHFLYEKFIYSFGEKKNEYESFLQEPNNKIIPFKIIHVYGQIEKLHWHGGMRFKPKPFIKGFEQMASNLRVIGERSDEVKHDIAEILKNSKRIFFLGFGYADENLNAINFPGTYDQDQLIYGTAFGMSEKRIEEAKRKLSKNFPSYLKTSGSLNPFIEDLNCYQLLDKYL